MTTTRTANDRQPTRCAPHTDLAIRSEPARQVRCTAPGLALLLTLSVIAGEACPQAGDAADPDGTPGAALPPGLAAPAAPTLDASQALARFALPDDLTIELVAAEPLVVDPVGIAFDGDGALWVVEMRGFMPDVDGTDELAPVGRIAVLHDDDGDGVIDRRDEFLGGLVLPRAVVPTRGGALVLAPPDLLFCRDTDGDGVADERTVVDTGFDGLESPEHAVNGLLPTLDNRFAAANLGRRWHWDGELLVAEAVAGGGQWGLTTDALGRLYFDTNSDPLRGHALPPRYALRHPEQGRLDGIDRRVADDLRVWPARMTPGVNRGYQTGVLDERFRLRRFTAACGPLVHLGSGLPLPYRGNAFVCEPAANLVKRYVLEDDLLGRPVARDPQPGHEWLSSTDERFRPVNLADGPDGCVYVVDLYRGILQHRVFMTTWLRQQVLERGLDQPVGLGRIWRVRSAAQQPTRATPLSQCDTVELVARLSHPDGQQRRAAQQRIVERGADPGLLGALRAHAAQDPDPLGRVHALASLSGLGALDGEQLATALQDRDARVRTLACGLAEPVLPLHDGALARRVAALARLGSGRERTQALLSLGSLADDGLALALLAPLAPRVAHEASWRSALLNGLAGRTAAFVAALDGLHAGAPGHAELLREAAAAEARGRRSDGIETLLAVAAARPAWFAQALLDGLASARPPGPDGSPGRLPLAREPAGLASLLAAAEPATADAARGLADALWWPGHPVPDPARSVRPLDADELLRFDRGRALYAVACASCHQASGRGAPGKAPSLVGSPWALGSARRVAAVLLHGLGGPIEVLGSTWELDMPALAGDDADIAAVLTYVRREWGNGADPITAADVAEVRAETSDRGEPLTVGELETLEP